MCEVTLPDELNTFYACFDLLNKESAVKSTPSPADQSLSVSLTSVRRTLLRVNMSKAIGPDNIPGHVLRTCANHVSWCHHWQFYISLSKESSRQLTMAKNRQWPPHFSCFSSTSMKRKPKKDHIITQSTAQHNVLSGWMALSVIPGFS